VKPVTLELHGDISTHGVIMFQTEKGTVTFNAGIFDRSKPGDSVSILYQKDNPTQAREDLPDRIWGDTEATIFENYFSVAISITNLYFTSLFSIRSYALLISKIFIISISAVILFAAQ